MRFAMIAVLVLTIAPAYAGDTWTAEQAEIIGFLENVPRNLDKADLGRYFAQYHKDYTGWYMPRQSVHNHDDMTRMIHSFLDKGYELTDSHVTPLHIEVSGSTALVRYVEEEKLKEPDGTEQWSRFHFVATLINDGNGWQFLTVNYAEVPYEDDSPAS